MFKRGLAILAALAVMALLVGLALQQLSCKLFQACLEVALEFQLEGRERFSPSEFWQGAAGYGLGLWLGIQLGWLALRSQARRRGWSFRSWPVAALGGALGLILGLGIIYLITASRWGIDLPQSGGPPVSEPGPGRLSRPEHVALEWPGGDHIPDVLEWWIMAVIPWGLAVLGTWLMGRRRRGVKNKG